jgi:hypothetical protein
MASGMARGAIARGKKIAFGDGRKIIWDQYSDVIFRGNPNVARPEERRRFDLEWIPHYKGHRLYNRQGPTNWHWNYDFRATPGEVFLLPSEQHFGAIAAGHVVIEPSVPSFKTCAPNKQWPVERYDDVARLLMIEGYSIMQFSHMTTRHNIPGARQVVTKSFRQAISALGNSLLYIGAEGGMHHGAAAMNIPAVVLFGGFVPPAVTGYDSHTNLTGGAEFACGSFRYCEHCIAAMKAISVDEVVTAALEHLRNGRHS